MQRYGTGPIDYGYGSHNLMNAPDNHIRYADMVESDIVSQYSQPASSYAQHANPVGYAAAFSDQYQYGVVGGQWRDQRYQARQQDLQRTASRMSYANTAVGLAGYQAASAVLRASPLKIGGILGAGISSFAVMPATMFLERSTQLETERLQRASSVASDLDSYSDQLGFSGKRLGFRDATVLGNRIASISETRYGSNGRADERFFDMEEMHRIHKIGMSSGMLNAGSRTGRSGTIEAYEKNFKELVETTEHVVKALNTTLEGGMSVINELAKSGLGNNYGAIKQQITKATGLSAFTGMSAQNMMGLGAAGSQAVQGTPFSAMTGFNQYQAGAVASAAMLNAGGASAHAVNRAGGVAQAGASIANTEMNMLSSALGLRMAVASMSPDIMRKISTGGVITPDELNRATSAYSDSKGANRVAADRDRYQMYDNMSARDRDRYTSAMFKTWRSSVQGSGVSDENAAYVFAGQFTNNYRDRELYTQRLMSNRGYVGAEAAMRSHGESFARQFNYGSPEGNPFLNFFSDIGGRIDNQARRFGRGLGDFVDSIGSRERTDSSLTGVGEFKSNWLGRGIWRSGSDGVDRWLRRTQDASENIIAIRSGAYMSEGVAAAMDSGKGLLALPQTGPAYDPRRDPQSQSRLRFVDGGLMLTTTGERGGESNAPIRSGIEHPDGHLAKWVANSLFRMSKTGYVVKDPTDFMNDLNRIDQAYANSNDSGQRAAMALGLNSHFGISHNRGSANLATAKARNMGKSLVESQILGAGGGIIAAAKRAFGDDGRLFDAYQKLSEGEDIDSAIGNLKARAGIDDRSADVLNHFGLDELHKLSGMMGGGQATMDDIIKLDKSGMGRRIAESSFNHGEIQSAMAASSAANAILAVDYMEATKANFEKVYGNSASEAIQRLTDRAVDGSEFSSAGLGDLSSVLTSGANRNLFQDVTTYSQAFQILNSQSQAMIGEEVSKNIGILKGAILKNDFSNVEIALEGNRARKVEDGEDAKRTVEVLESMLAEMKGEGPTQQVDYTDMRNGPAYNYFGNRWAL